MTTDSTNATEAPRRDASACNEGLGPMPQRWTGVVQAHCSGGFVSVGDYMAAMDELERLRAAGNALVDAYRARYRTATGSMRSNAPLHREFAEFNGILQQRA